MIDFHTHILPNIDDGARSVEETFHLIQEAQEVGFKAIVSTSHYMLGEYETIASDRELWIQAICDKLQEKNVDMTIYLGNEIYLTKGMIKLIEEKKASTIHHTQYVLFEMPLNSEPFNLYDVIYEMLQYKRIPILAHPERYTFVQQKPELIYELIQKGVLMQANYASIIGYYGKKAQVLVKKFLQNNMIHFLGSDVHRENTIYPEIPQILEQLKMIVGEKKLEELTTTNPQMVLKNEKIEIDEPKPIKLTLKEKLSIQSIRKKRC